MPWFHLISWSENLVESAFPQNFHTRRFLEIMEFYAVWLTSTSAKSHFGSLLQNDASSDTRLTNSDLTKAIFQLICLQVHASGKQARFDIPTQFTIIWVAVFSKVK